MYRHTDEDLHTVILEDTPSPPAKPPRGKLRKLPPMKPQRSALKIEPLSDDKENTQFKAKETMEHMQNYFKRSMSVIHNSGEFSGEEATDILEAYIMSHKEVFKREDIGRHNAILVLEMWRQQNIIKSVDSSFKKFEDSDRAFYVICSEDDQTYFCAASPSDNDGTINRSRRSNSFKRLFSPLVRRNRSNSRSRKDKSTWSVFSTAEKKPKQSKKMDDTDIYELALFYLLNITEVEYLEDVVMPVEGAKKNASFLSAIMEKMGLGGGEDRLDARQDDEMDLLIQTHPLIRSASSWFQMARICAPLLYLEKSTSKSSAMQLYLWCKAALNAVTEKLAKMTNNGASPLFPNEFSLILKKIATKLMNDNNSWEKLDLAVLYLFLLLPPSLRDTIGNIIQWLQITLKCDAVEDLRSPYYLKKKEPKNKENCRFIIDELRMFIFPKGCMTNTEQNILIETLIDLRSSGRLGKIPDEMMKALQRKRTAPDGNVTPVRYALRNTEALREKELQSSDGLNETEHQLVKMMQNMIDDRTISLTRKRDTLDRFSKHHPELYQTYFKNML